MDYQALAQDLKQAEGERFGVYPHAGHLYIGAGHQLHMGDGLTRRTRLTQAQLDTLLWRDLHAAYQICGRLWPRFADYPAAAQAVLVHVAYTTGPGPLA